MKKLSRSTKIFLVSIYVAGAFIFAYNRIEIEASNYTLLGSLLLLGSVLHILKVEGATNRSHYTISFLVYGFTLTHLGVPEALLVILASNLAEWAWNKTPWYIQLFNISCYAAAAQIAGQIYSTINPAGSATSWETILAIVAGMAGFTLVNHFLVGVIVWLARGENFKESGIFDPITLLIDLTMLSVGACMAIVWEYNPFALLIFLIPSYPLYMSLKIPALERKTETDQKTGLFNHNYFMEQLKNELLRANRYDRPLSIIMADLDLLRNINNTYGHLAGDEVLKGIAGILKQSVRDYDIIARFGGEEFSILMPETEIDKATERAEFIRREVESASFIVPTSIQPIKVTLSLGVATREDFKQTDKEIIHNADTALYHSKLSGRNQVIACVQDTFERVREDDTDIENSSDPNSPVGNDEVEYSASSRKYIPSENGERETPRPTTARAGTGSENTMRPGKPHATSNKVLVYVGSLALAALVLSALSFVKPLQLDMTIPLQTWAGLAVIVVLIVLTEWFSIDLYVNNTSLSTSAVPLVAGILLFGIPGVLLTSLAFAVTAAIKFRSRVNKLIFNLSNHIIAGMIINFLLVLGEGLVFTRLGDDRIRELLYALASSVILFICTTSLISVGIGLDLKRSPAQIWREQYKWMAPYYLGIGFVAYSLIFGLEYAGALGVAVMLAPLILLRYSQMQYVDHTRDIVDELRRKNQALEKSSQEINEMNEGLLVMLSDIIDLRDPYVLGHSKQVSKYATHIGRLLGLDEKQTDLIRKAGLLHDIGKLGIPMEILTKPTRLTPSEYEILRGHAVLGAELVKNSPSLRPLVSIIRHHHEFFNGRGYPDKLSGNQISIEARIVAVADAIEAMISDRPYRKGLELEQIIEELETYSGSQFDPLVVIQAVKMLETMMANKRVSPNQTGIEPRLVPRVAINAQTS